VTVAGSNSLLATAQYWGVCVKDVAGVGKLVAESFTDATCSVASSTVVLYEHAGFAPFKFYMDPFGDVFFIDAKGQGIFGELSP